MYFQGKLNWKRILRYFAILIVIVVPSCQNGCNCTPLNLSNPDPDKDFWTSFGLEGKEVYAFASQESVFGNDVIWAGTNGGGVFQVGISTNDPWIDISITDANCQCGINTSQIKVQSLGWRLGSGNSTLLAGTDNYGIFKLVSGLPNVQWQRVNSNPLNVKSIVMAWSAGALNILAASQQGVWRSTDGGLNWTLNTQITQVEGLAYDGFSNVIYAVGSPWGIYQSTDSGATWTNISTNNIPFNALPLKGLGIYNITLGTGSSQLYAFSNTELYRKVPNNPTWGNYCCGGLFLMASTQFTSVATRVAGSSGPHYVFVGTTGQGVFSFGPNGPWENKQGGMTNLSVLSLVTDNQGWVVAGTKSGTFRTKKY
jgi:hypothetical protein